MLEHLVTVLYYEAFNSTGKSCKGHRRAMDAHAARSWWVCVASWLFVAFLIVRSMRGTITLSLLLITSIGYGIVQ